MLEMKNPHPLSDTWNRSTNTEPMLVSNNKMKRKSRQPKRLFTAPEAERSSHPADMSDGESVDDVQTEACPVRGAAPLHTQQTGPGSGSADCDASPSHSGAIDMRIGNNVPALPSTLCVLPGSPEVSPWPSVLSSRLRASLHSQLFSMEPAPSHSEYLEGHSPQDSPRKRTDPPGRVPEVRAIQQTRRLLANARERTRVHTISAAFEALRKQVPCYSYGQKLSKLAILRIACNYILSLAQLAELDYSPEHSSVSFSQCVEQCTRTLQAEGRSKKRKE